MLSIQGLTVHHQSHTLVHPLHLQLERGEWLALAGESGSGKTLTSLAIGGLLSADLHAHGSIELEGRQLLHLPESELRFIRGRDIAYVFQDYQGAFTPFITVGKQMDEMMRAHTSLSRQQRQSACLERLEQVELPAKQVYHSYPFELSGGQLQRAAIATALLLSPKLLIADEPTTALDSLTSRSIITLIQRIQQETGIAILWITHDLRQVQRTADTLLIMKSGQVVESGKSHNIFFHPTHPYTVQLLASIPKLPSRYRLELQNKQVNN